MYSLHLTHPSTHTWSSGHTHLEQWTHTHTHTHTPGAVDTHTHLEQWTHTRTHTHTHLEQWTHTHTHTPGAVDTHTHLEQWTHTRTHTPRAVDTHTHTHLEQWTHTHLEQWTHTHTHTHTWSSGDTHTHTWSSGHTHTHTWSSGHTHTHTWSSVCAPRNITHINIKMSSSVNELYLLYDDGMHWFNAHSRQTHFFCDSMNLSYSTDILQHRAWRVCAAEQLVLMMLSPSGDSDLWFIWHAII